MGKKLLSLAALLLALATVLTACSQEAPPKPEDQPFTISAAVTGVQDTLDPAFLSAPGSETILYHLFENLMTWEDDGTGHAVLAPGQAASYQLETDFAGNATYTFTLREGLVWSDGEPVTAQDFVNAWRRLADPATASPHAYLLSSIAGFDEVQKTQNPAMLQVGARGENTLVVHLNGSCAYFLEEVCASPYTMPLRCTTTEAEPPAAQQEENGEGEEASPARTAALLEPVGNMTTGEGVPTNGRYTLSSFVQGLSGKYGLEEPGHTAPREEGSQITLEKSGAYWAPNPRGPQRITFYPSDTDRNADYERLQAGELDVIWDLPPEVLEAQQEENPNWLPEPVTSVFTVILNNESIPFDDANVRRSFRLAVNNREIAQASGELTSRPAFGLVPYGVTDYGQRLREENAKKDAPAPAVLPDPKAPAGTPSPAPWDFRAHSLEKVTVPEEADYASDCEEARLLLAQAGFPGGQGFPEVEFIYPASPQGDRIAEALQAMWREQLGVSVTLKRLEPQAYEEALLVQTPQEDSPEDAPAPFQMAGQILTAAYSDASSILQQWSSDAPGNLAHYKSPAYDILAQSVKASVSPEARDAYLHDQEAILIDDSPVIPLIYTGWSYGQSESITGLCRRPNGVMFLWNLTPLSLN